MAFASSFSHNDIIEYLQLNTNSILTQLNKKPIYPIINLFIGCLHRLSGNFNILIFKFNQMSNKEALNKRFQAAKSKKLYNGIKMNREVSEMLSFIQNSVKKQTESFSLFNSICGAQRRLNISPQFQSSFQSVSTQQKITYYEIAVNALIERQKQSSIHFLTQNETQFETLPIKIHKGLKTGPGYKIKVSNYVLDCSHYDIPLNNYILRRSNKNKQIFVFESLVKQEPLKIRFQIISYSPQKENILVQENNKNWVKYIFNINKVEHQEQPKVKLSKNNKEASQTGSPSKKTVTNLEIESKKNISPVQNFENEALQRSVIEEVFNTKHQYNAQQEIYQIIEQKQLQLSKQQSKNTLKNYRKNIARIILPHLSLIDIENLNDYLPVLRDDAHRLYIYHHSLKKQQFRTELYLKQSPQIVVKHLCEIQNYKLWNGSINESHVKLSITSDNAYLAYFKHRSYSNMYRERDFLFLRHLCRVEQTFYFVDCSIQNSHFIPFQSIIRGNINYCLTKVQAFNGNQCRLLIQISMDHAGLLNLQDDVSGQLTLRYLKEFIGLQSYITRFKGQFKNPYDMNWQINLSNQQTQLSNHLSQSNLSIHSNLFQQGDQLASFGRNDDDDDQFYSIVDEEEKRQKVVRYQITEEELKQKKEKETKISYTSSQKIEVDKDGIIILPKAYLRIKHVMTPLKSQNKKKVNPFTHLMLKNDFVQDAGGGMKLSNPQKEAAQNNVIKFIMSTLRNNLFAGKGILNISLPVQIFKDDSNIQRFCQSLSMAPALIERRKSQNAIQRFKNCVAFAFTNSVIYFDMDKAFNPILGETFQGFVDGCPIYGQQISHHPPISSIYMVGRGYKIYGNIEAKVYVHLNSGDGVNEGFYTVQFDDGGKVVYQTAPGEVSGLVMGNRKFRFKGKTFVLDAKNRLFCAINFQDESSGLFSKSKWKYTDQLDGDIVRVNESFIRKFFQKKQGKDAILPGKKDIEQCLGKVSGRWLQSFKIDDEQYFNLQESPYEMVHYQYPLNSNSDYREDLYYRKLNNLAKSQSEKERLQVKQRNDRKLKEKHRRPKH